MLLVANAAIVVELGVLGGQRPGLVEARRGPRKEGGADSEDAGKERQPHQGRAELSRFAP